MMIMEYVETASTAWGSPQVPVPSPCDTSLQQRMMGGPLQRARFEGSDCSDGSVEHTTVWCVPPAIERRPAVAPGLTAGVRASNMLGLKVFVHLTFKFQNKPLRSAPPPRSHFFSRLD